MKNQFLGFLFGLLLPWVTCTTTLADVLWTAHSEAPRYGRVKSQNGTTVEFEFSDSGATKTIQVDRSDILELVVTVDPKVLESLHPNNLKPYLDYAEELSSFRVDPYAMGVAKRLNLIVARWGSAELRQSAFRQLESICEGQERRQVQRLAFVYDSTFEIGRANESRVALDPAIVGTLVDIVRHLRRGRPSDARRLLSQSEEQVKTVLDSYSEICNLEELTAAVNATRITGAQQSQIIQLEQSLLAGKAAQATQADVARNWSLASQQIATLQLTLPEFDQVLPFDPRLTLYRHGKWVQPEQSSEQP